MPLPVYLTKMKSAVIQECYINCWYSIEKIVNMILQSLRLNFRPCTNTDVPLLLRHWTEPLVRRYLFDDRITDSETVEKFVTSSTACFEEYGHGLWLITSKTDNQFQGVCGLWEGNQEKAELLYSMDRLYWGQGLATESTQCVLNYGFNIVGLQEITATVDKPNTQSINVLEKLGMFLQQEQQVNNHPILNYSLTKSDYLKNQALTIF